MKSKGQKPYILSDTAVVYPQLKAFLLTGLKDTVGSKVALITQVNLLDSTDMNFGVFRFMEMSSIANYKIYLRNYGDDKITIIPKYNIEIVMAYLSVFFDANRKYITLRQRIACTRRVLEVLEARLD